MDKRRQQRINQLLREELSELLRKETDDPVLSSMISVTDVEITPDYERAKVFVSYLEEGEAGEEIMRRLQKAARFYRREIAGRINLRHTPELVFVKDESIAQGARILQLLREVAPGPETPSGSDAKS
jgi:ribosome-binding factor A